MKTFKGLKSKFKINGKIPHDKYYELAVNANNWRKTAYSLLFIVVILSISLAKIAMTKKIETFIIEKSGHEYTVVGNITDVAKTQKKVTEAEIIYFLNEVINNTKGLPRNTEIYEKNYRKSLAYLSRSASQKIDNYLKEEKYVDKVKNGKTVEITFNTGNKVSENTYQIRWKQVTFNKQGGIESEKNYNAILTIAFQDITNPKTLSINPLGLIILDFSQKEELL